MHDRIIETVDLAAHEAEWSEVKSRVEAFAKTLEGGIR
jgi:hypothetical protein